MPHADETLEKDPAIDFENLSQKPENSFGYLVRRCHRRFDRALNARLAGHGIKTGFWYYLRVLWMGDRVTQKYLSDMTNVAENTTVSMIEGMAKAGIVKRVLDEADKRKRLVELTAQGRALEGKLTHHAVEINQIAVSGISVRDLATCRRVLLRMSENLERDLPGD